MGNEKIDKYSDERNLVMMIKNGLLSENYINNINWRNIQIISKHRSPSLLYIHKEM